MTVTGLEPEPRVGGVRVRVDGRPFATLAPDDASRLGLAVGQRLTEAQREAIAQRAELFSARAVALRMLGARPLPARELERRLRRRGFASGAAASAVAALVTAGLVNDAEFARHYVRTRVRRRLGAVRLVADLGRLGVDEREAEAAVREVLDVEGVDQHALLREAARRKLASLAGVDRERRVRRLRAYLLRRGFARADVRAVVKESLRD
jgi:regulatory protein